MKRTIIDLCDSDSSSDAERPVARRRTVVAKVEAAEAEVAAEAAVAAEAPMVGEVAAVAAEAPEVLELESALWARAGVCREDIDPNDPDAENEIPDLPEEGDRDDLPSDDEEFSSMEHFFSMNESDRASLQEPEYGVLPGMFTQHWRGVLEARVRAAAVSDCFRQKTMYKLCRRFMCKSGFDLGLRLFMHRLLPHVAGESWYQWKLRFERELPFTYYKLCVLYDVEIETPLNLETLSMDVGEEEGNLPERLEQNRDALERVYIRDITAYGDGVRLNAEDANALSVSNFQVNHMITYDYVPRLNRFDLFSILDREEHVLKVELPLVWRKVFGCPHGNVPYPYLLKLVSEYLIPNYRLVPVRGPFRAGFRGSSKLPGMYGATRGAHMFFCNCESNGQLCGHPPLRYFLKDREAYPFY